MYPIIITFILSVLIVAICFNSQNNNAVVLRKEGKKKVSRRVRNFQENVRKRAQALCKRRITLLLKVSY